MRKNINSLRRSIERQNKKLMKQKQKLSESQQQRNVVTETLIKVMEKMKSTQSQTEELVRAKEELENVLKLKEMEIEVLKESTKKEKEHFLTLRKRELVDYQMKLDAMVHELKVEKQKSSCLQEELQKLMVELTEKSVEVRLLRQAEEKLIFQLELERERADILAKEMTLITTSHASCIVGTEVCFYSIVIPILYILITNYS